MQTFKLQISLKRTLITIFRRELIWFYVMPSSICHLQFTLIILKTCKISKKKKCSIFRIYMAFIIKKDNAPWILLYWFKVLQSREYFDDLHLMLHKKIKYVPLHLGFIEIAYLSYIQLTFNIVLYPSKPLHDYYALVINKFKSYSIYINI